MVLHRPVELARLTGNCETISSLDGNFSGLLVSKFVMRLRPTQSVSRLLFIIIAVIGPIKVATAQSPNLAITHVTIINPGTAYADSQSARWDWRVYNTGALGYAHPLP
jgi:hypothetical protein